MSTRVLIVGAGPAGLAAAVRAHSAGAAVTVVDDNAAGGGQIWRGGGDHGRGARRWLEALAAARIQVRCGTRVVAAGATARSLLVETPEGARELPYDRLVLATGARELFLPFPGWTLPGVAGAGGLQALVLGGLPISGKRAVVAGSGPLLLAAAAFLRSRGTCVLAVVEQAPVWALARFAARMVNSPGKLVQAAHLRLQLAGVPYLAGSWVAAAEGDGRVQRVHIRTGGRTVTHECDYVAAGFGLVPNTELAALLGCRVTPQGVVVDALQQTTVPSIYGAGECAGIGGVETSLAGGEIAGFAAAGDTNRARHLLPRRERARRFAAALQETFALRPEVLRLAAPDTIVCRCEDVPLAALATHTSFRAAKLHTRCGMGPCQGRICGAAAHHLFGWDHQSVRPPVFPAAVATLAYRTSQEESCR